MQDWKIILSGPANAPCNMAIDEYLFIRHAEGAISPVFRLYSWDKPCVTIGYFQPSVPFRAQGLPVVRRLTGGLSVIHGKDLSFSLTISREEWPGIYSQEEMYRLIHQGIRKALNDLGYPAEFSIPAAVPPASNTRTTVCVTTIYPYDLLMNGRKIVGSCQRRRGKTVMVQGSIHVPELLMDRNITDAALIAGWATAFNVRIQPCEFTTSESSPTLRSLFDRYAGDQWNMMR